MAEQAAPGRRRSRDWGLPVGVAVALVLAGTFGWLLLRAQQLPATVVPVAWDKTACAHCRMHVGEPGFAAQLQLRDGRVLDFDDPGCLASWLDGHPQDASAESIHAMYFHHLREDRWLSAEQARFVSASPSPMGFGLAALDVDAAPPSALTWEQARARMRDPTAARGNP